ncbi:Pol polyprotein [Smittium culicis]|uniref:Pol polyprotein n=1 Tax=Smittium culicis TaxID=133412 RepID=A0A1R1XM40_9FUNG|nr:Pol polyprotein [Smittium culicis]
MTPAVLKEVHGIDGLGVLVKDIVAECEVFQRVNYSESKASLMNIVGVSNPFSVWGIDVASPIPESKDLKNKYIIVGIDYYTKWPVARATKDITTDNILKLIKEEIFERFGIP